MVGNEWSGRHRQGKFIIDKGIASPLAKQMLDEFERVGGNVVRTTTETTKPKEYTTPKGYEDFPFYRHKAMNQEKK
jgi:hypothetical protein